jgi:hypothetical protein
MVRKQPTHQFGRTHFPHTKRRIDPLVTRFHYCCSRTRRKLEIRPSTKFLCHSISIWGGYQTLLAVEKLFPEKKTLHA